MNQDLRPDSLDILAAIANFSPLRVPSGSHDDEDRMRLRRLVKHEQSQPREQSHSALPARAAPACVCVTPALGGLVDR